MKKIIVLLLVVGFLSGCASEAITTQCISDKSSSEEKKVITLESKDDTVSLLVSDYVSSSEDINLIDTLYNSYVLMQGLQGNRRGVTYSVDRPSDDRISVLIQLDGGVVEVEGLKVLSLSEHVLSKAGQVSLEKVLVELSNQSYTCE